MRLLILSLLSTPFLATGCGGDTKFFCDENTPCLPRYPDRPFCDLTGATPESEGIGQTCVPEQRDASVGPDAPVNMPIDAGPDAAPDAEPAPDATPSDITVTVSTDGAGSGTVLSDPLGINCGATCSFDFGFDVPDITLSATPSGDSDFVGWTGEGCTGTGDCTVSGAPGSMLSVAATFELKQYDITTVPGGDGTGTITAVIDGGTTNIINCGSDCSETLDHGTMITLTATPTGLSQFGGWSGDGCSGLARTCSVTMDQARTIGAAFDLDNFSLAVSFDTTGDAGDGTVTSNVGVISCPGTCSDSYAANTAVSLTATPDATSTFDGWSGACSGTGACNVTMTAAQSVTAKFTRVRRTLTISKVGDGDGLVASTPTGINCGADCSENYVANTMVVLAATPDATSSFDGWTGGGCASAGTGDCTVNMTTALNVSARFTRIRHDLTVMLTGTGAANGQVTATDNSLNCTSAGGCTATYVQGTSVTLSRAASNGAVFVSWGGACSGIGTTCGLTMNQPLNVTANFCQKAVCGPNDNGILSDNCGGTIDCGLLCNPNSFVRCVGTSEVICSADGLSETTTSCDNGLFCDGSETCNAATGCQAGTPPTLTDGVACTTDTCNETTNAIDHVTNNAACSNGLYCDGQEICDIVSGCIAGALPDLDDGIACTVDTCNEAQDMPNNTPDNSLCANNSFCDGTETCSAATGCVAGSSPCGAGETCLEGSSPPGTGTCCTPKSTCNAGECGVVDDGCGGTINCGMSCSGNLTCGGNGTANVCGCNPGAFLACSGSSESRCNANGVSETTTSCVDSNVCNGTETCNAATGCQSGAPLSCVNQNFCDGVETCNSVTGCVPGTAPCSPPDVCQEGNSPPGTGSCCTPKATCNAAECGIVADGCGGTIDCGMNCSGNLTCGGNGTANVCGCSPSSFLRCDPNALVECSANGLNESSTNCPLGCTTSTQQCNLCVPNSSVCAGGVTTVCGANGTIASQTTCALGCYTDGTRCTDVDPSNGLGFYLDGSENEPIIVLPDGSNVNTDNCQATLSDGSVVAIASATLSAPPSGVAMCVLRVGQITIGNVTVTGSRALAIVSHGDITIDGPMTISAGAYNIGSCVGGNGTLNTDGGTFTTGTFAYTAGDSGGGFGRAGGKAGNSGTEIGPAGGSPSGVASLVPLRGGCRGGGGSSSGNGGGAIQLVSRTSIRVVSGGNINARGLGGRGIVGSNISGVGSPFNGTGGGSGGGILLEAPRVELASGTGITANGGGGGCYTNSANGFGGGGTSTLIGATGAVCTGTGQGDGGAGGAQNTNGGTGTDGTTNNQGPNRGGGGGGGGVGRIRVNSNVYSPVAGSLVSPLPSTGALGTR